MSIPGSLIPLFNSGGGATSYQVSRSLRFNPSDSAYLSRTPASAGNRKTWTWSGWVKRSGLNDYFNFFGNVDAANAQNGLLLRFMDTNAIDIYEISSSIIWRKTTASVYRDSSAWFHLVVQYDTTNATAADRVKLYVNGETITAFSSSSDPSLNYDGYINNTSAHSIGRPGSYNAAYFSGYLADIHFIDGQALTPSSFGETDATTGQWIPKAYTGTYGTNGFKLNFADNSAATAAALGKDTSGNGNNWTPNNLSVTAGAGNDSLVDTPTSYGTDTGVGGEVRGNYCTLNPLSTQTGATLTYSEGNLKATLGAGSERCTIFGTLALIGKTYWEIVFSGGAYVVGMASASMFNTTAGASPNRFPGDNAQSWGYGDDGSVYNAGVVGNIGSWVNGDVIGWAYDSSNGSIKVYKNGSLQGSFTASTSSTFFPAAALFTGSSSVDVNFGQRPFAYTAPSGFKALCDTNLPAPVVAKPNTVMDVALYTGNGTSGRSITGLNFSPDFVWIKQRSSAATDHVLFDSVRGATKALLSDATLAELTNAQFLQSFDANGFTVGSDQNVNNNAGSFVGWCWDAGSSTVTNTAGTIQSSVRANASAGFSIVTYTGTGSVGTIGHGLNTAPSMVIVKRRDGAADWPVWHKSLTAISVNHAIILNLTDGAASYAGYFNGTSPTSTVFTIYPSTATGANNYTYVAYCFTPVAGYSAFGSYTGNGSADGPFVYTGFRPRWIMVKRSDSTGNWTIKDTSRPGYNVTNLNLFSNLAIAETTEYPVDLLSNGFKVREGTFSDWNASGGTYIYAAFAEFPFQYARAR